MTDSKPDFSELGLNEVKLEDEKQFVIVTPEGELCQSSKIVHDIFTTKGDAMADVKSLMEDSIPTPYGMVEDATYMIMNNDNEGHATRVSIVIEHGVLMTASELEKAVKPYRHDTDTTV